MNAVVVIIDRNPATAQRSESILRTAGYEVVLCPTDDKAREHMRNHHVDAVVVMANVEDASVSNIMKWHEDYCGNAYFMKTSEDPQHLAAHIEKELGDW